MTSTECFVKIITGLQRSGQDDWGLPTASKQDDVRRLGCILYWLLSRGQSHPFGTSERRLENLHQNKYELKNISAESYHLIWLMIDQTVPCCAIFRHPFFWTDETITAFFQAGYYVISTGSCGIETFPISPTNVQDSDLGRWFKEHGGIPRDSHSVLQSFVSWVSSRLFSIVHLILRESLTSQLNELEARGEEFLFETYQRWGRSMKDIFPDFPLQLWAVFVKNIVDERDELDHWYIPTCEVNVDQVTLLFTYHYKLLQIINRWYCEDFTVDSEGN